MSIKQPYSTSLRSVGAYQVSGRPWVKGAINADTLTKIQFPFVTRWIVVTNTHASAAIQVAFHADGVGDNCYIDVPFGTSSPRLEVKCNAIWVKGPDAACISVAAGLTNIPRDQMYDLSGDGIEVS